MIRFKARENVPRWLNFVVPLAAVVVAVVVAGIVLAATSHNPLATYRHIIQASITQPGAFSQTLVSMTPLLFTGLAAAVAFRMRLWNIGGEGQLYMGAVGAAWAGLFFHSLPGPLLIAVMIAAGVLAGTLWASIPGALRAYLNTNEILTTLMLNYVAANLMYYLIFDSTSYWRDLTSASGKVFPQGKYLPATANWPPLQLGSVTIPFGLLLGIGLALLLWGMIRATRYGYEMRVLADSPAVGKYAGMRTRRKILSLMAISGGLAGLGGASQVGDFSHVLDPRGLEQAGFGYSGIVVAALARYNPVAVIVTSFFIGMLVNAGFALQGPGFPIGLTGTMEGILLFCVLGAEIFTRYRLTVRLPHARPGTRAPVSPPPPVPVGQAATHGELS
jgi:general nucleoside transport system permease protein